VDDGSRDASLSRLREIASQDARVRVLRLDRNRGQSAALEAGFRRARGEAVATLDADLQNDPADLPRLLALLDGADVINGVRTPRHDAWQRRLSSFVANGFRNRLTGENVSDVGCSLRVMRSHYLRRVKLRRGLHRFLPTLLRRSKYGIQDRLFSGLVDVLAVRWMQRRALHYRVEELDSDKPPPPRA
jgi:glycosyltransferase involved in cell wall biosynthesis